MSAPDPATETVAEEAETAEGQQEVETAEEAEVDYKAEAERWKALARKNEKRATANAGARSELEKLRNGSLSEQERVAAEAEERGRKSAQVVFGERLASAEIRAALTGIVEDPSVIIEDLNLAKYIDEDGEVDDDAVKALRVKYTKLFGTRKTAAPVGHGNGDRRAANVTAGPEQDFANMLEGLLG